MFVGIAKLLLQKLYEWRGWKANRIAWSVCIMFKVEVVSYKLIQALDTWIGYIGFLGGTQDHVESIEGGEGEMIGIDVRRMSRILRK